MRNTFTKSTIITATLLSTLGFGLLATAAPMVGTGGYNIELKKLGMMKMLDDNGDHMVTQAEFNGYYGHVFDELDANGNGTLDVNEWTGTKGANEISLGTGGYSRELRKTELMDMVDSNADHIISKAEFTKFHQSVFATMDKNSDKQINPQEWLSRQVGS
ncbi:calcium-binding protein [Pseudomethylobacillus aquaticus]|uniref:Calcium-binding protein n=1 Tax=Pseudomethylobacillus aquaticus TaxID=2676064 RepID=A0A3N0V747_9PROT|nr:calcium-binding protein [Pseudomethylobacillus aquaticus]ROH88208.1 calcium-binding protein [Pseudomethylobacillus aquaticus]